jgi:hypothetical protein
MKKRLYLITTIILSAAVLSLSSCLKDSRYVDLTKVGTIVEFPFGGISFFGTANQSITGSDTIVVKFAVNVASPTVPTTATPITFDVNDPATIAAYYASNNAVNYLQMPVNAYVYTQNSITIPAGVRDTAMTLTIYANKLDPTKSYMIPISIKSAGGYNISGNQGTMYFHIIGNVFAGAYRQTFRRFNEADSLGSLSSASFANQPTTFSPVSPKEFVVYSGYADPTYHYDVTFTDNGNGTYSNFAVSFPAADITTGTNEGITILNGPVFLSTNSNTLPGSTYTVADAQKLFDFQFGAQTSAPRYLVDYFYK